MTLYLVFADYSQGYVLEQMITDEAAVVWL